VIGEHRSRVMIPHPHRGDRRVCSRAPHMYTSDPFVDLRRTVMVYSCHASDRQQRSAQALVWPAVCMYRQKHTRNYNYNNCTSTFALATICMNARTCRSAAIQAYGERTFPFAAATIRENNFAADLRQSVMAVARSKDIALRGL
jgi:hypothetical protein